MTTGTLSGTVVTGRKGTATGFGSPSAGHPAPTLVLTAAILAGFAIPTTSGYPISGPEAFSWPTSGTAGFNISETFRQAAPVARPAVPAAGPSAIDGSAASIIASLRQESGLTWEQLARLFGVSRRAVHLWASGGNMNSHNYEAASQLLTEVRSLAGHSPEARRDEILMPRDSGKSLLDQWKLSLGSASQKVNPSAGIAAGLGV